MIEAVFIFIAFSTLMFLIVALLSGFVVWVFSLLNH